jgi:hypothetical protein
MLKQPWNLAASLFCCLKLEAYSVSGQLSVPLVVIAISAVGPSLMRIHSPVVQNSSQHRNLILLESHTNGSEFILAPGIRSNHHHQAIRQPS